VLDEHDAAEDTRSQRLDPVEVVQTRRVLAQEKKEKH
jgi:hypothetical protein